MKLTKLEAIDISLKLWRDLAENGYKHKDESEYYSLVEGMSGGCALCEYIENYNPIDDSCRHCPLWDTKAGTDCTDRGQPFDDWEIAIDREDRKEHASRLVKRLEDYRETNLEELMEE